MLTKRTKHTTEQGWFEVTPDNRKTQLDILLDIFFSLSSYITLQEGLGRLYTPEKEAVREILSSGLASLLLELNSQPQDSAQDLMRDTTTFMDADPLPGCLRAMRSAAYIILLGLKHSTHDQAIVDDCEGQALAYSADILKAVDSIDTVTQSHSSRIFVTTVFPLEVVATWSPSPLYRSRAKVRLQYF